jgi:hypothetical protein
MNTVSKKIESFIQNSENFLYRQDDESVRTSETSAYFNEIIWRHIPKGFHIVLVAMRT